MYMYLLSIYLSLSIFLSITGEMTSHILKLAIEARSKTLGNKMKNFILLRQKDQNLNGKRHGIFTYYCTYFF